MNSHPTLTYLGNSCILLTAPDGTRIVADPYADDCHPAGLANLPADLTATAVTVSHTHPDHNNAGAVGGSPLVLSEAGITTQVGAVKITACAGREGSPDGPSATMANTIFVFEVAGVKIVHMGDSGIITDPEVLALVAEADLILVNIDGYVIPLPAILPFMEQIRARTVLLTHYSLSETQCWVGAPTADEYLQTLPAGLKVTRLDGPRLDLHPVMPTQILVMTPALRENPR